jgi:hypothetical protein
MWEECHANQAYFVLVCEHIIDPLVGRFSHDELHFVKTEDF